MRRKTLINAISAKLPKYNKEALTDVIKGLFSDEKIRGERLSTEDFVKLSNALCEL